MNPPTVLQRTSFCAGMKFKVPIAPDVGTLVLQVKQACINLQYDGTKLKYSCQKKLVMIVRSIALCAFVVLMQGCSRANTCSLTVGKSSIAFGDVWPASSGEWYIHSIVCDGSPLKNFQVNTSSVINGRCSDLGDTDVDLYWKFRLGSLCYPDFAPLLEAKANKTLVPAFVTFTAR